MVVYIELAFLENFCLDLLLLSLAAYAARAKARVESLLLSAFFGAVFAVLFPLLSLPAFLAWSLKLSVGALLPLPVLGKDKWGLGILLFFGLTFLFGGALLGFTRGFPAWARFPLFGGLLLAALVLIGKAYKRREIFQYLYDCEARIGEKSARTKGFFDSGNLATKDGLPVCFLAPDLFYDLVGEKVLFESEGGEQGCVEMQIFTQSGAKVIKLFKGTVEILDGRGVHEVYFACGGNRIGKEYKILLHSRLGV